MFTPATKQNGKITLGIDVTAAHADRLDVVEPADDLDAVKPEIVSVTSSTGQVIPVQHTRYYTQDRQGEPPRAIRRRRRPCSRCKVPKSGDGSGRRTTGAGQGARSTRPGKYLVGFYLPGDASGDGTVNSTDITTIKSLMGDAATNSNYNFDADVNRDGIINNQDVRLAKKNLGASTTVSPVVSVNLDPASDPTSDRTTPFSTVHFAGKATPGATVTFANRATITADHHRDGRLDRCLQHHGAARHRLEHVHASRRRTPSASRSPAASRRWSTRRRRRASTTPSTTATS